MKQVPTEPAAGGPPPSPLTAHDLTPPRWLADGAIVYAPFSRAGSRWWVRARVERAHGDAAFVESLHSDYKFRALFLLDDLRVRRTSEHAR